MTSGAIGGGGPWMMAAGAIANPALPEAPAVVPRAGAPPAHDAAVAAARGSELPAALAAASRGRSVRVEIVVPPEDGRVADGDSDPATPARPALSSS